MSRHVTPSIDQSKAAILTARLQDMRANALKKFKPTI
jgi:hypothetical protein